MKNIDKHDDVPDKTLSELKAGDESEKWRMGEAEYEDEHEEYLRLAEIVFGITILTEMFKKDLITAREYFALMDFLEDEERKLDVSLM